MFQSFLSLYPGIPTWVGVVADVCTILTFILMLLSQKRKIKDLELRISNTNNNSLEQIQNKIIGFGMDDVIKLLNEIKGKDTNDKVIKELFPKLVDVVQDLAGVMIDISNAVQVHNGAIKDILSTLKDFGKIIKVEGVFGKFLK